jgi:hypothetical protein
MAAVTAFHATERRRRRLVMALGALAPREERASARRPPDACSGRTPGVCWSTNGVHVAPASAAESQQRHRPYRIPVHWGGTRTAGSYTRVRYGIQRVWRAPTAGLRAVRRLQSRCRRPQSAFPSQFEPFAPMRAASCARRRASSAVVRLSVPRQVRAPPVTHVGVNARAGSHLGEHTEHIPTRIPRLAKRPSITVSARRRPSGRRSRTAPHPLAQLSVIRWRSPAAPSMTHSWQSRRGSTASCFATRDRRALDTTVCSTVGSKR